MREFGRDGEGFLNLTHESSTSLFKVVLLTFWHKKSEGY